MTSIDKGATILIITTLDIMTFSIILTKHNPQHMLTVLMPTVTYADCHMLSVVMLNVIMRNVVMLNVLAP